ncbi:MAG TPA: DoxX family protein [Anaeromyxobacteraceae bacterium]|nr:DoxX family protein [Anaeromyxobacteraceae bacterium]
MTWLRRTFEPGTQRANLVVRLLVGLVFLPEGMKKFLFAAQWGAGRFERIGIPYPAPMASLVGGVEIGCGLLVVLGLATRLASVPLLATMAVAIATTKLPLLWRATAVTARTGFWSMQSESRTDYAMVMGLLFLLVAGAGPWSLDAAVARRRDPPGPPR